MHRRRPRRRPRPLPLALLLLLVVILAVACFALANAILGVNPPRLGENTWPINPTELQPLECRNAGITPGNLVAGTFGSGSGDLILGNASNNTFYGFGGDDCIVGGAGNDRFYAGAGTDVCVGGPGNDRFIDGCEYSYQ